MYLLVIYSDISNCYEGINSFETILYTSKDAAVEELKARYYSLEKDFICNGCTDNDGCFEHELTETTFTINDGSDYYSAEIRKIEVR